MGEVEVHFKRKRTMNGNPTKQRLKIDDISDEEESQSPSVTVQPTNLRLKNNPLFVCSRKTSKEEATSVQSFKYLSDRRIIPHGPADQGATLQFELETEEEKRAARLKKEDPLPTEVEDRDGRIMKVYRGMGSTQAYHTESQQVPKALRSGPARPTNTNLRAVTPIDYQPDICKDYKETGFCGYGDNCIYMHDRGDYKSGWQIERDWNEAQKSKRKFGEQEDFTVKPDGEEIEDDLPFACSICRGDFIDPVVTRCGHYYCEKCALEKWKKGTRCFLCGENTKGIFNSAPKLIARLKKMKKLQRTEREPCSSEENDDNENPDGIIS